MIGLTRILVWGGLLAAGSLGPGCQSPPDDRFGHPGGMPRSAFADLRQINTRIGVMQLDDNRWGGLDSPTVFGLDYVEDIGLDWLALEGGLSLAYDEQRSQIQGGTNAGDHVEESLALFQFSAGALLAPAPGRYLLRPYVGAGGVLLWSDVDSIVDDALFDDDDNAVGAYAKVGLLIQITADTHVGFELRWLDAQSISAGDQSLPVDGVTFAIVFGASYDWFGW